MCARHPGIDVATYRFHAVRPLFDTGPFWLCGTIGVDGVGHLFARDETGALCVEATAMLRRHSRIMLTIADHAPYADIREAVRALCAQFPDEYHREIDQERAYPEAFVDALTQAGWLAALIPEQYGGSGLGLTEASIIMEEINRSGGNSGACHGQMYNMGTVLRHGSDEQKRRYLPDIASGKLRLQAMAVTEPTTGSDTTRLKTRAVKKGDRYVVSGQKVWISRIQHSDLMILLARTTPVDEVKKRSQGLSVFLVDVRAALAKGMEIRPIPNMVNHETNEVFFDELEIPAENLIGEEGRGFGYILDGLNAERTLIAAECIGDGYWFVDRATRYARERIVFGRPIGQNHDEAARYAFVSSLRNMFMVELFPGMRTVYHKQQLRAFQAKHGRAPESVREASDLMEQSAYYRGTNVLGRAAQELLWDTVGESVERQLDTIDEAAKPRAGDLGTLRTDPALEIPRYIDAVDIHVMPGNFHTELSPHDTYAGALYDCGVHVFSFGGLGPRNDGLGVAQAAFIKENFSGLKPRRILDMGCGPGLTTLPWKEAYADAEVNGIDIGAPQVRYAHGRAESMGVPIHFSQQNATATDFPDGYLDVVVSMLVTHECPQPVIRGLFKEAHRLLAPGGITLRDGGITVPYDTFDNLLMSWFGNNANEPFSAGFKALDYDKAFVEAGFPDENLIRGTREPVYLKGQLPPISFVGARRE